MKRRISAILILFFTCTVQAQVAWDYEMVAPMEMRGMLHLCGFYGNNLNRCWAELQFDELRERSGGSDDLKSSVLYTAITRGYAGVVNSILEPWAADIDFNAPLAQTESGDTPLILAARLHRKRIVEILLSVDGIDVDAQNGNGETAWDVTHKIDEEIRLLLVQ